MHPTGCVLTQLLSLCRWSCVLLADRVTDRAVVLGVTELCNHLVLFVCGNLCLLNMCLLAGTWCCACPLVSPAFTPVTLTVSGRQHTAPPNHWGCGVCSWMHLQQPAGTMARPAGQQLLPCRKTEGGGA